MTEIQHQQALKYTIVSNGEIFDFKLFTDWVYPWQNILSSVIGKVQEVSIDVGIPLTQRGEIQISFLDLDDCLGRYVQATDEILINRDQHGMEIESTLFHEILHYFYDNLFQFDVYGPYLTEGFATYYEQHYYPKSEFWLLQYWLEEKHSFHTVGYFMFKDNKDEVVLSLKNDNSVEALTEVIPCIVEYEAQVVMRHFAESLSTICRVDFVNSWGVLFAKEFDCPYLISLSPENVERLLVQDPALKVHNTSHSDIELFLQGSNERVVACAEEGWERIAEIIARYADRIREKYRFHREL